MCGFPGARETCFMMYTLLYAMSKGLNTVTTAIMCKRTLQLGGSAFAPIVHPANRGKYNTSATSRTNNHQTYEE